MRQRAVENALLQLPLLSLIRRILGLQQGLGEASQRAVGFLGPHLRGSLLPVLVHLQRRMEGEGRPPVRQMDPGRRAGVWRTSPLPSPPPPPPESRHKMTHLGRKQKRRAPAL